MLCNWTSSLNLCKEWSNMCETYNFDNEEDYIESMNQFNDIRYSVSVIANILE